MKPENEVAGTERRRDEGLWDLLDRLNAIARAPMFRTQRDLAIDRVLHPYVDYGSQFGLYPLPEEAEQANLYVFADYFPEDGQLSLIEQIRDTIEVHVPDEERAWLDPLKHSFIDLLEITGLEASNGDEWLCLRSLGDGGVCRLLQTSVERGVHPGQVILARVIHIEDRVILPGSPLVISASYGRRILDATRQWQRQREAESGSFELSEWAEFVKRFGYVILGMYARARLEALVKTEAGIEYVTPKSQPFLYALALYDHHAFQQIAEEVNGVMTFQAAESSRRSDFIIWTQGDSSPEMTFARLTLTPSCLIVECDSPIRLDNLKHDLASTFGFLLHFAGETVAVPQHELPLPDLETDEPPPIRVLVPVEEEHRLMAAFLESVYLEWADRPSPSMGGLTPRHAAVKPEWRDKVAALIDERERNDLGLRRTGTCGYNYNLLRGHVGLSEVHP